MTCYDVPPEAAKFFDIADCLCTTVQQSCSSLCWCGFYPGGIPAFDHCGGCQGDSCGMGFVTLDSVSLYSSLGSDSGTLSNCDLPLQANISAGVLRCMPVRDDGEPLTVDEMAEVSIVVLNDMLAIRRALTCCYEGDLRLGQYQPIPPNGGCVGGLWTAVVALD